MKKILGISAYNIREGGPLTILKILLDELRHKIKKNHKVYVYLNNKNQINFKQFDKKKFKFFFFTQVNQ